MMKTRTFGIQRLIIISIALALCAAGPAWPKRVVADLISPRIPEPLSAGYPHPPEQAATTATAQRLGFRSANSFEIGATWYDMQQNGSMGRQIVVGNGWVHNVWNYLPGASNSNRNSSYYAWELAGAGVKSVTAIDPILGGGGFSAIDFDPTGAGAAIVTYHRLSDNLTRAARDTGQVVSAFRTFSFGAPGINCQGIISGAGTADGPYLWPKIAVDIDGSGQSVAHVVSVEYRPAEVKASLVYYQSNLGITAAATTCASWIDSVSVVGAVVAQDPNSDRVAIVYPAPADWSQSDAIQQRNNDVAYRQSTNLGTSWSAPVNITNYVGSDDERLYTDLSAMYTADGCLHALWTTSFFDSATAQVGNQEARLYHWSDCSQCLTLLLDAGNSEPECKRGIWSKNISKMSLSECTVVGSPRLYATYTYFTGDADGGPGSSDCSQGGFANGEIYGQVSQNSGATWGPPVNLTNTTSANCAAGNCLSEHWSSSALYVSDSLRLQYILDKDAGSVAYAEGTWTLNSVANLAHPCFATESYSHVSIDPTAFQYPFHTAPSQVLDTFLVLTNSGNAIAAYTRGISFQSGANWLVFPNHPPNGNVPVGCVYFDTLQIRVTGPVTEGFYEAIVAFTYHDGTTEVNEQIEFDLYNFASFYQPEIFALRTATVRMAVNQAARTGNYSSGNQFTYFAGGISFLRDASLILGTSRSSLSWLIYDGAGGTPTASNPFGRLYAASGLQVDTTGSSAYRFASGTGVNRDSTIGWRIRYYAPKNAANSDYLLARVDVYPGPHNLQGQVNDLTVGFAADWDIPSDIALHNTGGGTDSHQLVYQQGTGAAPNANRFGGLAVIRVDGAGAPGGFVWENSKYVSPLRVYHVDSLWNRTSALTKFESSPIPGDLNSVVVGALHETLSNPNDTLSLVFIMAGQLNGTISSLKSTIEKAWLFNCLHVSPDQVGCPEYTCGDADGNSLITISDAVFLITYIFGGGPAPSPLLAADCDCNQLITISDAVYLISYIFGGGPAPCANCP